VALLGLLVYPHLTPAAADAAAKQFDFKDPKGVNTVVVSLDSLLEPVAGVASGISGMVEFDPENPRATTGRIQIETASLKFVNDRFTQTAHSERGLNATAHPTIEFSLKRVRDVRRSGTTGYVGTVEGEFSCHGVTKPITVPLRAAYLAGKARDRNRRTGGDLLVLRTTFMIRRSDYQIATGLAAEMLAEEVEIRANIVGVSPDAPATTPKPATAPAAQPASSRAVIGDLMTNASLPSVRDGAAVALLGDRSQKATVAAIVSAFCPVSGAYDERLRVLGKEDGRKAVRFVAINARHGRMRPAVRRHGGDHLHKGSNRALKRS
jgi:polyisoprenoid-binding protein YceI